MGWATFSVVGLLLIIVVAVMVFARRGPGTRSESTGDGDDILTYLLLAVAVGVTAFQLMALAQAAFPGTQVIAGQQTRVATALASLVVAVPIAIVLWRRQRPRRDLHPNSSGWTLYLTLIELVFMTTFAITLVGTLTWWFGDGDRTHVTDLVVLVALLVFHELAVRATPPGSDARDLPRVVGSAIGLVTLAIGIGGLLTWGLESLYELATPATSLGTEWPMPLAMTITGGLIWWFRWLQRWTTETTAIRSAWTYLVATFSLSTALATVAVVAADVVIYLTVTSGPAWRHFTSLPAMLAVILTALAVWWHHRRLLGSERSDPVRYYEYFTAGLGLSAAVGAFALLVGLAFTSASVIAGTPESVIGTSAVLLVGGGTWYRFWSRAQKAPAEVELASAPRRAYLLGLGVIMAVTSAIALITTLVGVFQLALGVGELSDEIAWTTALFIAAGGVAWHSLSIYSSNKEKAKTGEAVAPFHVTVICSHPGLLASRFHQQGRMKVLYRADDSGVITDEMADRIVEEVANRSSVVWVDDSGFRVAPIK